ncbi:ribosomal protein L4 domain-containing protein [Multifurca ochricompacta]|uniref:Large ribosomal subunit protein uL4m n=1 Tax=Multifurca ochricompacta TaxID=376703 RepID=A0AAD4QQI0_9AGAM|nr:ribosomal protein L4 domain-containing protein [Multifurca ochricompacta]
MLSVALDAIRPLITRVSRNYATAAVANGSHGRVANASVTVPPLQAFPTSPLRQPVYVPLSSLIRTGHPAHQPDQVAELDPTVFAHSIRRDILHLCVVHHLDSLRQGSANTKTRAEVRGSGRKIRAQKGSGKARLGDGQSPMLRGGGIAFGPKPRDFATKLPRKVIQMGMRVALSARVKECNLRIVESLDWTGTKTKDMIRRLDELGWDQKTLFITGKDIVPPGLKRSTENLHKISTTTAQQVGVYDLVKWSQVVLDIEAVRWFEHILSKDRVEFAQTM